MRSSKQFTDPFPSPPIARRPSISPLLFAGLFTAILSACYFIPETGGPSPGGASGGTAGAGGATCEPGSTIACYSGPAGTEGVGLCVGGTQTCNTDGSAYGPCIGQVTPLPDEDCDTLGDDDCDGEVNELVASCCIPNTPVGCYEGPPETKWVGICKPGTKICNADGTGYGACADQVLPAQESCETSFDDDCDGQINEDTSACCTPGEQKSCYDGPLGTEGVGICMGGIKTCDAQGGGFGPCEGQVLPQTESCTSPVDESCDGIPTCTGEHIFSKHFGNGNQTIVAAVDRLGNLLIAGGFDGTTSLGGGTLTSAGGSDIYVAKLNANGTHAWSKRFGNPSAQAAYGIAVDDEGSVLVTGAYQGSIDFGGGLLTSPSGDDIFVLKLDAQGDHVWSKSFGGVGAQVGLGIGVDQWLYPYLTGKFTGTLDFGDGITLTSKGTGTDDVFIAGLNMDGSIYFGKAAGDTGTEAVGGMTVENMTGDVLVTGRFPTTIDFGDGVLMSAGGDDIFLARVDYNGSPIWTRTFGDAQSQAGAAVALDVDGNVLLAGDFSGTLDFGTGPITSAGNTDVFVAKLTGAGDPIWSKRFGDVAEQRVLAVASDTNGNILVTGYYQGSIDFGSSPLTSSGGRDIFIAKLLPAGDAVWSKSIGDSAFEQRGVSIGADDADNVMAAGKFEGTIDLGGGSLVCNGTSNVFVGKFGP